MAFNTEVPIVPTLGEGCHWANQGADPKAHSHLG
jgi:hypothetical protein